MSRGLPAHGTPARYAQEKSAGRRPCPECCEANAVRVRAYAVTPRGKELARARQARFKERKNAKAHEDALTRWVRSVVHAEGGAP